MTRPPISYVSGPIPPLSLSSPSVVPWEIAHSYKLLQILQNTEERTIRPADDDEPSSRTPVGLYLVRGDNVVTVGLVDEELDQSIDWTQVHGALIGGTKHA